jgi:hypothetical protein
MLKQLVPRAAERVSMTRVETSPAPAERLPPPAFDPPPRASDRPARTPAPDPDASTHDDDLRRFIDAARPQSKPVAPSSTDTESAAEVNAQRSARIRAFYDRLDVQVPVLDGEPGETRRVAVPFRMSHPYDNAECNRALLEALGSAPSRVHAGLVIAGRGTAEIISAVVRDLAERHPEQFAPQRTSERVRRYLRSLGVGIDCAGSVQLALFESRGLSPEAGRAHFKLRARVNEDLSLLDGKPQFPKVTDPAKLRPGDLVILRPPRGESVGHTVIVTESTPATLTAAEASKLSIDFPDSFTAGKPVVKVSVASSFGFEGPQERVWVYDPETKSWGDLGGNLFDDAGGGKRTPTGRSVHSGPWNHDIQGMYHPT